MFEISVIEVENQKDNTILKRSINLDKNLDCFLIISSKNKNLAENLLNNVLENIIDKISKEEAYNDFGIALENINSFLKNWRVDGDDNENNVDMAISILNDNNLMFSNIGKSTIYLVNKNSEVIELTERNENKKSFLFISSGFLANSEIVISSTLNILKYLSKSDIIDGMILSNDMEIFNKNIKNILQSEIVEKNCIISSLKFKNEMVIEENKNIAAIKDFTIKILDTDISKRILGSILKIKDKISNQNKTVKNTIFFALIGFLILILFLVVSRIFGTATKVVEKEEATNQIQEVSMAINEASGNVSNPGIFNKNIEKAEKILKSLEEKDLYANDISKFRNELNILKKQFNKIEIFNSKDSVALYEISDANIEPAKVIQDNLKVYIVTKKGVIGPIISNTKPKTYTFSSLGDNEFFTDGGILGQDLYLKTNTSKVVRFNKNGSFSFASVSGQQSWEKIRDLETYNSSIYNLGEDNQIYVHRYTSAGFGKGIPYLKEEDSKSIGELIGMGIDGGFYLVKKDLSVVKFFSKPYRLESLTVSNRPENYVLEEGKRFEIKTGLNLSYVYMLLNNKVFIFNTSNAKDYLSTRNLSYVGQIEGSNDEIIDFAINRDKKNSDGEIIILNKKGIYKIRFEESNGRIVIR